MVLYQTERLFLGPGLPNRIYYKHLIEAPHYSNGFTLQVCQPKKKQDIPNKIFEEDFNTPFNSVAIGFVGFNKLNVSYSIP